jgi:hypothetical protein
MHRSVEKCGYITAIMLEFLILCTEEYYPPLQDVIRRHVQSAIADILQKGVVR